MPNRVALLFIVFTARGVFSDSPAADGAKAEPGVTQPEKRVHLPVFYLRDAGKIMGTPQMDTLTVKTRYGTLSIPAEELIQVRFSRRIGEEDREKIEAEITRLGAEDYDARETAMEALRAIGAPAKPFLLKALKSGDEEVENRAEILLGEIVEEIAEADAEESLAAEDGMEALGDDEDDEVISQRFTLRGRIVEAKYRIQSRYGQLQLDRSDITGIAFGVEQKISRQLKVAASHTVPASWFKAKVNLSQGRKIIIQASGQVTVSRYNLTAGPEGTQRYSGNTFQNFPMLALVGKIGKNGKPFLIGKEWKGVVKKAGILYLGLVPFRRNYAASGVFQVKVSSAKRH